MSFIKGKVAFVGDTNVGKTSLIYKYNNCTETIENTIASTSIPCTVDYKGTPVTFNVWDTAGQDDYRCLVPMFVKGAQIAVIVFDITNPTSFEHVNDWLGFLDENCNVNKIFLVSNKVDLPSNVSLETITEYAKEHQMKHFMTSALNGQNVDVLFYSIAEQIQTGNQPQPSPDQKQDAQVEIKPANTEKKHCSC
ncbi:Ras family protein [Histomonas meleagridis]|uniref:Ras family protein n=1 Tax=Histomonas meleagridis TaxID=135588 RepID=UPI00355A494E|nr:Ras family protein [Histomonas meleagridis]KAH0804558.1 Ras family protein [Histomonas meleagridis]